MTRSSLSAQQESARHLLFLYSVVAALSLETAMSTVGSAFLSATGVSFSLAALTIAFLVTIVPFFHGALRHIDDVYVLLRAHRVRRFALFVDFIMLFIEAALLFLLAGFTEDPHEFIVAFWLLLAVDIAWALVTSCLCRHPALRWSHVFDDARRFLRRRATRDTNALEHPELFWAFNNLIWFTLVSFVVLALAILNSEVQDVAVVAALIIAVLRTVCDYRLSWSYYFSEAEPEARETMTSGHGDQQRAMSMDR